MFGYNFIEMVCIVKEMDLICLVYYEGDFEVEVMDVYFIMYMWLEYLIRELLMNMIIENLKKLYILCEYCYVMGNGFGNLKEY